MATNVLWLHDKAAAYLNRLAVPGTLDIRVVKDDESDGEAEALRDWAEILVAGNPSERLLSGARVRSVIVPWAGVGNTLMERVKARPHLSLHNSHYNSLMVAHHAVALLMACSYRIVAADRALRNGDWGSDFEGPSLGVFLPGKVALLVGYGSIGTAARPLLEGLGLEVRAYRRTPVEGADIVQYGEGQLREALSEADVVLVSLPATPHTVGLLGADELAALKSSAILVNVGRGPVVDEEALYRALESRSIMAAGIDVWYRYPEKGKRAGHQTFPSRFPFQDLDNVVMSPHRANDVRDWPLVAARDVLTTLEELAVGRTRNRVDLELGY